jgi:hypothetical protein
MNKRRIKTTIKDKQEERKGDQQLLIRMNKGKIKVTSIVVENEQRKENNINNYY